MNTSTASWVRFAAPLAVLAALVVGVPALGDFWTFVATLAVIYALLGVSLVVLTGWTGQLNLHIAALGLGWGAYASYALTSAGASSMVALLGAAFLTIPFSLLIGFFAVRFRGLELAVATLAIGLTFEQLVFRNLGSWLARGSAAATPFESSFVPVSRPSLGGLSFKSDHAFYLLTLVLGVAVYMLLRNLARSSTRRAMLALRERELAAEVAGLPALRYRTAAFVLSIAVAGLGGALFAALKLGIAPDSFNLDLSFLVLSGVVIGGVRTLRGGVAGGALAAALPEVVRFGPLELIAGERLLFVFAAGLVLILALRPQGLLGPHTRPTTAPSSRRRSGARSERPTARSRPIERRRGPAALRAQAISVHFGGVQALDGVDVWVPSGEICALIGPNGAGKTTLFNALSGVVTPDSGRVYLDRDDITEMPPHRRAALRLGRTFQSIELFEGFTALENVMIGAHLSRRAGPVAEALALPAARRSERELADRARDTLSRLGIANLANVKPDELASADLRRLELASVLVREPTVLLLDEPTAGLDPEESKAMADLIVELRDTHGLTVLLVEHDMAVVGAIADWVYVLDFGRVIAEGSAAQIRRDPVVIDRYLGEPQREGAGARSA
jgi:branched-chain amino acid transport system permease protein